MMAASYVDRAVAIQDLTYSLRRRFELASVGAIADKMAVIDLGVEVVNKVLYCFLVSQELFESVEKTINPTYQSLRPIPAAIDRFFVMLLSVICVLERRAAAWVKKYS
jgi:hypothetical protein